MNLANIIGNDSVIIHKAIIRKFGLNRALILGLMVEKWVNYSYGDFYYKISDLAYDTTLSEQNCRAAIQSLIDEKILIKKEFKGLPPKQYYSIDEVEALRKKYADKYSVDCAMERAASKELKIGQSIWNELVSVTEANVREEQIKENTRNKDRKEQPRR